MLYVPYIEYVFIQLMLIANQQKDMQLLAALYTVKVIEEQAVLRTSNGI